MWYICAKIVQWRAILDSHTMKLFEMPTKITHYNFWYIIYQALTFKHMCMLAKMSRFCICFILLFFIFYLFWSVSAVFCFFSCFAVNSVACRTTFTSNNIFLVYQSLTSLRKNFGPLFLTTHFALFYILVFLVFSLFFLMLIFILHIYRILPYCALFTW